MINSPALRFLKTVLKPSRLWLYNTPTVSLQKEQDLHLTSVLDMTQNNLSPVSHDCRIWICMKGFGME